MSEVIYTKCDGCTTVINVDPGIAMTAHGWTSDEYESHFCPACQHAAEDLEKQTATPEEMAKFAEAVNKAADKPLKLKKR